MPRPAGGAAPPAERTAGYPAGLPCVVRRRRLGRRRALAGRRERSRRLRFRSRRPRRARIFEPGDAVQRQELVEFGEDAADHARAPVDQRRVELERARAGADLGIGVAAAEDAADPDQRQPAPGQAMEATELLGRPQEQGGTAQSARLVATAAAHDLRPRSRGVADDQAVDVARERHLGNPCLGVRLQIRSDLEQQRLWRLPASALRASTSAASSSSSRARPCRSRSPGVFGDDTLTVR